MFDFEIMSRSISSIRETLFQVIPRQLVVSRWFLFCGNYVSCRDYEPFHFVDPRNIISGYSPAVGCVPMVFVLRKLCFVSGL